MTYTSTQMAVAAITSLDRGIFQGRLLHALPGKPRPEGEIQYDTPNLGSSFKTEQLAKVKSRGAESWNSLFINADAVADHIAENAHKHKGEVAGKWVEDLAVKMALEESKMI